jgi:isopentenyl-diphosphate Delta-isomerase
MNYFYSIAGGNFLNQTANKAIPKQATLTQTRKADHLRVCLEEDVQFHQTTNGLEHYRFTHCFLPEIDRRFDSVLAMPR